MSCEPRTTDGDPWAEGGCHCGAIRFAVCLPAEPIEVIDCNCSICTRKGILHLIVEPSDFRALSGDDIKACYRFGSKTAEHWFCPTCGIHPYYRPRSHPSKIDVNVRALDAFHDTKWRLKAFDGQNWQDNIDGLRCDLLAAKAIVPCSESGDGNAPTG